MNKAIEVFEIATEHKPVQIKEVEIKGVLYKIGKSSYWSDHSALYYSFDGGKTWEQDNIWREISYILENPDKVAAMNILWPNYL